MAEGFNTDAVNALANMESGDTFAARIEEQEGSIGPRTEYFRVTTAYGHDRHLTDRSMRLLKAERCRNPSADHSITCSVHGSDGVAEIHRLGPSNITIHAVSENTNVDYTSDRTLVSTCTECGNTGVVPVGEDDLPAKTNLANSDSGLMTTCCSADWTCSLN